MESIRSARSTRKRAFGSHTICLNGATIESKGAYFDITGAEWVEVQISGDGTVLWVHTDKGTTLRICQIQRGVKVLNQQISRRRQARN